MKTFSSVSLQNVNDGAAGATGPQGPQGTSVTKVVREYTKSSSSSTLPSNPNWSETEPTIGANEYLWARDRTDKSDGTSSYGLAICSTNISDVKHNVDKANKSITDKVWEKDITTKINQYDGSTVSTIRERLSTTETDISGIKTRVSDVESETDDLGTRMATAETAIDQTANNVLIKATKSDTTAAQGGKHLIESLINVAPSGVTISADKVNIEGATIFSSGRLSQTNLNNAYDAKGSAATAKSEAISSANTSTDNKLKSYSTTTQMNKAIEDAVNDAVDDVEANANKTTVPVYYRSTTNSTPSISASTTIGTSNNTDNAWSYVMPLPKKNAYFYICEEYTSVSGTKTFSTVRKLDSQTYASKWVSSNDNTLIDGGSIYAHSITSSQLATDAIKSTNYQAAASGPYSAAGTFLDLSNGNFYTPNFGVQSLTGKAYLNGEIIATSGSIGDDSGNYWSIGNTIDSQGNGSASIVGNGTAFIQDGDWQIHSGLSNYSNGSINTQWYIQPQGQGLQLTYPYYDGYYYDYGMTSPVLDANSDRFYNQTVSQNFLYIRKHASTIPALESDWNYIFRIDKDGMIWINGQSLTQMIQSGVDGGAYLPTSGGTVNGNVTITGTLTATASKANQLTHTLSINGKGFDGSGDVNVGTIGAAYGGTGQTSLINSANALLNALGTGSSTPVDNDYYISQYVGGGTTTTTYHRRPMSALWSYIKGKLTNDHSPLDSSYVLKSGDTITGSLTVENGIYSDSAQLGDLIVTGAGRFANGLYGDLIGNADTATKAAKVADSGNGTETTFAYSKTGLTTTSWIAAWNNYELRAISPANLLTTIGADKSASISDRINTVGSGNYNWTSFTYDDKLITSNTLAYWNGAYNSSSHASNIEYVKAGKLGDIVTHNASEFLTTSGNAASATKFNSTRTISLTGDVTGSASSDGSSGWSIATTVQDNSHNHISNNIVQGNMGLAGKLDPLTQALIGSAASNKSFGLPANAITIEYSTDGGSTWKDYGATDAQKKSLFNETRTTGFYLGKATTKESNTVNNQLRVTIEPTDDRYTTFNGIYCWYSTSGNTSVIDLERSTIGAPDTFTTVFTGQSIAGWSGNNIRYFSAGQFGGGSNQTGNYYKYRITFRQTAINSNYASGVIYDIRFLGLSVYGAGSTAGANNILTKNRLYTWDNDLNAIFPAGITATSFTGNASSASKLNSTRSFTIGKTAKNVDWSGAVSFSKAEISNDASSTANGWMSIADKKKLDSITVSDIGTIGANSIRGEKDIKVTISSGIATIGHENAAITAGTISGTATSTLSNGGSFKIPSITYDAYGHITGTAQTTVTLPNITSVSGNAGTATAFSSNASVTLTGDTTGTASSTKGWSIATTTSKISYTGGRITSADIMPSTIQSKIQFSLATSSMTTSKPPAGDGYITTYAWDNSNWGAQFYIGHSQSPPLMIRGTNGSAWGDWKYVLTELNYNNYAPTKTGAGASGTWGISISGNATTATSATESNKLKYYASLTTDEAIDGFLEASRFRTALWTSTSSVGGVADGVILSGGYSSTNYGFQLAIDDNPTYFIALRQKNKNGWADWKRIPMADGTGASGNWSINASTATTATYSYYPKFVASNELRFDVNSKPSSAINLYVGYKWSDGTSDAKINRYNFYNGGTGLAEIGASTFHGDLSGNATSATKAVQDGSGNTIASTYLKLSGGTMTGAINLPYNKQSVSFRSDNASYDSGFVYGTGGNEALALVQQNAVTSFMVVHGSDPATWTTSTWNSSSPTLQTKNNSLYVHELIPSSTTPSYNFKVNGSSYLGGEVKISDTNADTASVSMVYDRDMGCLNFIFN